MLDSLQRPRGRQGPETKDSWKEVGCQINSSPGLATKILKEAMAKWPAGRPVKGQRNNFWAGHRQAQTGLDGGLNDAEWADVVQYYDSIQAIKTESEKNPKLWEKRDRYGVDARELPPI